MRIAICIPTFNQCDFLPIAVRSCLAQKEVEVEVWVSDDGSTDRTPERMQEFENDPRVNYCRKDVNEGIAANAGWVMSQPTTDYIVRLDSDDVLHEDYCRTLSTLLSAHPSAAIAHCNVVEINQRGEKRRVRRLARNTIYQTPESAVRHSIEGYKVAANICMFRTECLRRLPFIYREGMDFCEDWDLFVRLAVAGFGNVHTRAVLANYRVWSDTGGYRQGRKATELKGIQTLFAETIEPEWCRRGWDLEVLDQARKKIALGHVSSLQSVPDTSRDHSEILRLISELSLVNRDELLKLLRADTTWRGQLAQTKNRLLQTCKNLVKPILYR